MSTVNTRATISDILAEMKRRLEAATWTPAGGDPEPAFGEVKIFTIEDETKAFQQLIVSEQRACFIISAMERFNSIGGGLKMILSREYDVALIISDRAIGDQVLALQGDKTTTAGAQPLREIALTALVGQLLNPPTPVHCVPTLSMELSARAENSNDPGRMCVTQEFQCTGGILTANLTTPKL